MTSTKTEPRKIPAPLYAAAGAGELAYEQLLKLPERVEKLRGRVAELRPVVTDVVSERVSERALRSELDKIRGTVRDTAKRNAQVVVTGAQVAQERAFAVYTELVARGERVVAGARTEEARAQLATAKIEIADAEKVEAKVEAEKLIEKHAEDATAPLPTVPDKATKRARPAAK
jgi:heparin binding hemagglutinin HbhA